MVPETPSDTQVIDINGTHGGFREPAVLMHACGRMCIYIGTEYSSRGIIIKILYIRTYYVILGRRTFIIHTRPSRRLDCVSCRAATAAAEHQNGYRGMHKGSDIVVRRQIDGRLMEFIFYFLIDSRVKQLVRSLVSCSPVLCRRRCRCRPVYLLSQLLYILTLCGRF